MDDWTIAIEDLEPEDEAAHEALLSLSNGYFATRGASAENTLAPTYHGTYVAGFYDRATSDLGEGRRAEHEELARLPAWPLITFRREGGEWLQQTRPRVLEHRRALDLRRGILRRVLRVEHADGARSRIEEERFVSMRRYHVGAQRWTLTPEGWSGTIDVRASILHGVENRLVERYRPYEGRHLELLEAGSLCAAAIFAHVRTRQSHREAVVAVRTAVSGARVLSEDDRAESDHVAREVRVEVPPGGCVTLERIAAVHTSGAPAISEPRLAATEELAHAPGFDALAHEQAMAWRGLWSRADVEVEAEDPHVQRAARFHAFHLLSVVSPHVQDLDAGVPARGLSEGYRGHVFWDELFMEPFVVLSLPELTRSVLLYRWRRLERARIDAGAAGLRGALYPWRSGSDGREETPREQINPLSGRFYDDHTRLQRHVNGAIAHNVWRYVEATRDAEFLARHGAEIFLEIARLFDSLAVFDRASGCYRIRGVVGPDEFHVRLPGAREPGVDDNTYTNVLAAWVLRKAPSVLAQLPARRRSELLDELAIDRVQLQRFEHVARNVRVVLHDDGVPSQFDGWDGLEELDWESYRARYGDVRRLDWILHAEGDDVNRYKVAKQADVLMLFYLFDLEELAALMAPLGVEVTPELIERTVAHYRPRTSHGSSLSRVVQSWVMARLDRAHSWHVYGETLDEDLWVRGGHTAHGVHLGAMATTLDLLQRCYGGVSVDERALWLHPRLPDTLTRLRFGVRYLDAWLEILVTRTFAEVHVADARTDRPARIGWEDEVVEIAPGERRRWPIAEKAQR